MHLRHNQGFTAHRHRVRCITFDLDDTLWECAPVIQRAEKRFYEWLDARYPRITERYSFDELIQSRIAFMKANQHQAFDLTRLRKNWLTGLAREAEVSLDMVEAGFCVFWEARNQVELFNGVRETLRILAGHFVLGSITNGNADVNKVGLGEYFDFSVTAAEAGVAKPEKAIFQMAADRAGVGIDEVLHVGDDSDRDVIGALDSGAQAAWVTADVDPKWLHALVPSLIIGHVQELPEHILPQKG